MVSLSLLRRIEARAASGAIQGVRIGLHPELADAFQNGRRKELSALEEEFDIEIEIIAAAGLHRPDEQIEWFKRERPPPPPKPKPAAVTLQPWDLAMPDAEEEEEEEEEQPKAPAKPVRERGRGRGREPRREPQRVERKEPPAEKTERVAEEAGGDAEAKRRKRRRGGRKRKKVNGNGVAAGAPPKKPPCRSAPSLESPWRTMSLTGRMRAATVARPRGASPPRPTRRQARPRPPPPAPPRRSPRAGGSDQRGGNSALTGAPSRVKAYL